MSTEHRYFLVVVKYDKEGNALPIEPCNIVKSWADSVEAEFQYKNKYRNPRKERDIYQLKTARWLESQNIIPEVFEQVTSEPSTVYQINLFRLVNEADFALAFDIGINQIKTTVMQRMNLVHALQENGYKIIKQK